MAGMPDSKLDRVAVSVGVERVYKAGRGAFARARAKPTDSRLHEWRKQVKYLFNQIDGLSRASGGHFSRVRKLSDRLGECLGEDHDLAVLRLKMQQVAASSGTDDDAGALYTWAARIGHRRAALQAEAYRLGDRLYAGEPRDIRAKIDKRL